jgi:hypothetical protein
MGIGPEDEALPVDPGIEVVARTVDENLEAHLAAIDDQLRQPDLSDEEINRLLDERTAIMEELNVK